MEKIIDQLILKSKEQGFITFDDISNHLGDDPVSSEQMEQIFQIFSDLKIEIFEYPPIEKFNKKEFDKEHKVNLTDQNKYINVGLLGESEDNILERDLYRKDFDNSERRIKLEQNFKKEKKCKSSLVDVL